MSWTPHPNSIPLPGWKPRRSGLATPGRIGLANPRTPAVPATLDLTLEEYFASGALVGLLSSMGDEPEQAWVVQWTHDCGARMAAEARKRRALTHDPLAVRPFPRRTRKGRKR